VAAMMADSIPPCYENVSRMIKEMSRSGFILDALDIIAKYKNYRDSTRNPYQALLQTKFSTNVNQYLNALMLFLIQIMLFL
jgi:hypothetical protein